MSLVVATRPLLHPDVVLLNNGLQAEYTVTYGGPDATPVDPAEFEAPHGSFAVGYDDDRPVAMGGWRLRDDGRAELKRLFVVPDARGHGHSRAILAALEESARAQGSAAIVLEANHRSPQSVALYLSAGYTEVDAFGHYADDPLSLYLGKTL